MRYKIEIIEILSRIEIVSAPTLEEVVTSIREKYRNEEIVLDAEDFCDVEFHVMEEE
jgi:hypothetical protein